MEFPWPFTLILPDGSTPGYILFNEPMVKAYSTQAALTAGGGAVLAPDDIKVLVPYSLGALTATIPADVSGAAQYEGTAFTTDTVQRTLYIEYRDWIDRRDMSNMLLLAREHLDSRKDTVYEGQLTYEGKLTTALALGKALNLGRVGGTTGLEALKAIVKSVSLEYQDSASIWLTRMRFSTRRRPFAGDRLFAPVAWGSSAQFAADGQGYNPFAKLVPGIMRAKRAEAMAGNAETAAAMEGLKPSTEGPTGTGGYTPEGPGRNVGGRRDTYEDREKQAQRDVISGREQSKKDDDETRRAWEAEERRERKEAIAAKGKPDRSAVTQSEQVAKDRQGGTQSEQVAKDNPTAPMFGAEGGGGTGEPESAGGSWEPESAGGDF